MRDDEDDEGRLRVFLGSEGIFVGGGERVCEFLCF